MYTTLGSLVERAIMGNQRPLEFYLRDQSRLPGPRANLELLGDFSDLLAAVAAEQPEHTRGLLKYLTNEAHTAVKTNTPEDSPPGAAKRLRCWPITPNMPPGACGKVRPSVSSAC